MSSDWDFNFYDELGIPKTASQDEIKKAYRKMAMKWHPDKNQDNADATDKFQRISHAYSILSDPKKRDYYDRYGKVDEDNFNFEEFMKGFTFDFGDIFGGADPFFMGGSGVMEGRHSIKLMSVRKSANNEEPEIPEDFKKYDKEFPTFIYGNGKGLESKANLSFWKKIEDDEWEEVADEEHDEEEFEECDDEDLLEFFVMSNTANKGKTISCNYCKVDKESGKEKECDFTKKTINQHFIDTHKEQFEEFFGPDASWEEAVETEKGKKSKSKKDKKGKKKGGANMFGGGMPFMFDMGQMGGMFNMSPQDQDQMMKDLEKMMGGMGGMGGFGFPGMDGFPGMPDMGGKKKKK